MLCRPPAFPLVLTAAASYPRHIECQEQNAGAVRRGGRPYDFVFDPGVPGAGFGFALKATGATPLVFPLPLLFTAFTAMR